MQEAQEHLLEALIEPDIEAFIEGSNAQYEAGLWTVIDDKSNADFASKLSLKYKSQNS